MQYLLMCSFNEEAWSQLPNAERDQLMNNYGSCIQEMKRSGHYLGEVTLDHAENCVKVLRGNGEATLSNAPLEKTKEELASDHLLECKDLTEAISLAKRLPKHSGGAVEVRAVLAQNPSMAGLNRPHRHQLQ
jgi:hypothetical protein